MPVLGRREVGGRRAGGVVMGAPQIGDGPPPQTTGRERILPVMRYLILANRYRSASRMPVRWRTEGCSSFVRSADLCLLD